MRVPDNFPERLIKGRIGETVFELLFREDGKFDLIPLGYEHITPQLLEYHEHPHIQAVIENIRALPDFILVSKNKEIVYLVEVKYRAAFVPGKIKALARQIATRWRPAWLFLATPEAFYFSPCGDIVQHEGHMERLSWISPELQEKYLALLTRFM